MPWIESHDELPTHPKTWKASRRLGVNIPTTIGHLHVLWYWCLTHRPDGELTDMDAEDIAAAACWDDDPDLFVDSLAAAGWLDLDAEAGCYAIHDWWDGAGKTIKRRRFASQRQRRARDSAQDDSASRESHADVTRDMHVSHAADSDSDRDIKASSSRKRADRATRLTDGWIPQPEPDLVAAVGGQQQADAQLDRFRDYWTAQPGARGRKVDWQATWRNWLRRAAEDSRPRAGPEPRRSEPLIGSDEWERRQQQLRQREIEVLGEAG